MKAQDMHSPRRLADLRWTAAVRAWERRDGEPLAAMLRSRAAVPAWVRDTLADMVKGKAARPGGRPRERTPEAERALWRAVMAEWDASGTREQAIAAVAEREGVAEDALRGIVARLQRLGLTRELWARMRPK